MHVKPGVGAADGEVDGSMVGTKEGTFDGTEVGSEEGTLDSEMRVGSADGTLGSEEGTLDAGIKVGIEDGTLEGGTKVGSEEGTLDGEMTVGSRVSPLDGGFDGTLEGIDDGFGDSSFGGVGAGVGCTRAVGIEIGVLTGIFLRLLLVDIPFLIFLSFFCPLIFFFFLFRPRRERSLPSTLAIVTTADPEMGSVPPSLKTETARHDSCIFEVPIGILPIDSNAAIAKAMLFFIVGLTLVPTRLTPKK